MESEWILAGISTWNWKAHRPVITNCYVIRHMTQNMTSHVTHHVMHRVTHQVVHHVTYHKTHHVIHHAHQTDSDFVLRQVAHV